MLQAQPFDNALNFDDVDDQVVIPHQAALNFIDGDFTLEAWVNPSSTNAAQAIFTKGHRGSTFPGTSFNFSIYYNKIGLQLGGTDDDWLFSQTNVPIGQWSQVAVSYDYDNKIASFYLNGNPDGQENFLFDHSNSSTDPLYIGRQGQVCNCNFFGGAMDDLAIWDYARTATEINGSYLCKISGDETGLIAAYNFDSGEACMDNTTITNLIDISGNSHDGTLVNFALANDPACVSNWVNSRECVDTDGDDICDVCDPDDDNDGIDDYCDSEPLVDNFTFTGVENLPVSWICGNNPNNPKVIMCHNMKTKCISPNAVQAHLNHGDMLGECVSCEANQNSASNENAGDSYTDMETELEVFPNPARDVLNVHLHGADLHNAQIIIYDNLGKIVWQKNLAEHQTTLLVNLSGSSFTSGIYTVTMISEEETISKRILISK